MFWIPQVKFIKCFKVSVTYWGIILLSMAWFSLCIIIGSFHAKSPEFYKTSQLTLMYFVKILSSECIHQEMKILKILSFYHVQFGNYDQLKYGPFSLNTKPLKFLSFWSCFYSAIFHSVIFNRKHIKFGLAIHFHTIFKKMYLAKNFIKQVCDGVLKLSKLLLWCFSFHFQRAISWQEKIQMC